MLVAEWSYDGAKKIISLQMGEEAVLKNKKEQIRRRILMEYDPFPRKVQMDVTAQMVQKWIKDEALQDFLDYLTVANPCVLSGYLTERQELFEDWILSGGGAQ